MERKNVLLFIIMTGVLDSLMKQIDMTIEGVNKTFKKNIPDLADELDKELSEAFWDNHKLIIKKSLYEETTEHFSDEDLQQILDFFNSPAGKAYRSWRVRIENRSSKYVQANVEMHRQANNIYNRLREQSKR